MSVYDANAHCWSGLLSRKDLHWQDGLRDICREIGDVQFHPSKETGYGYDGWREVAEAAIARGEKNLLLIGHSNGGYAITKIARMVKPHGIICSLVCFDRTRKACPKLGSNVDRAIDIWAGLKKLEPGSDFNGSLKLYSFQQESHIGVINNKRAKRLAIDFGKEWKKKVVIPDTDFKIPDLSRWVTEIIWHCAATPEGRSIGKNPAETIDRWHKERGWDGIGYHAVVDLDGSIHMGRDWNKIGAHVKGHNTGSLGFCYVGGVAKDGKTVKDTRTDAQRAAMLELTKAVTTKYPNIGRIAGHREYAPRGCPSFEMPEDKLGNIHGFLKGRKQ